MFNLLSGEFYKWKKSKSFVVCCVTMVAFIVLLCGMFAIADKIQKGEIANGSAGVVVADDMEPEISIMDIEQSMFPMACIFVASFVSIFVIGEYGNGAIKNIIGKGTARGKIFMAKYITSILAVMVILILMAVVTLIGGMLLFGTDSINAEFVKNLLQYVGVQLLLGAAYAGIIIAIGECSRNLGVGISVSLGVLIFADILFNGLDLLFYKTDFKPSAYWVMNLVSECPINGLNHDFMLRAGSSVIFWLVVSAVAGMFHFKKADVK